MCVSPMTKKHEKNGYVTYNTFPCGKCPLCIKRKTNDWQIRLNEELKRTTSAYFITLTYDENNVPHGNNCLSLCKKDFQMWMKRLRYYHNKKYKNKLVYYGVGEYGKKTQRPHYHAIIYNLNPNDIVNVVHSSWTKGFIDIKPLTDGGVGYVLKYLQKQTQKNNNREREFSLCSKNIGSNYCENTENINYHKNSFDNCFYQKNQTKFAMPRYYKLKIYNDEEVKEIKNHQEKRHKEKQKQDKFKAQAKKMSLENYESMIDIRKQHLTLPPDNSNYVL